MGMTETGYLRAAILTLGGVCDDLPDNLESTLYRRLIETCNGTVGELSAEMSALEQNKLSIQLTDGIPNHGTAGQFAVSDGKGGIMWKTLVEAEEVAY